MLRSSVAIVRVVGTGVRWEEGGGTRRDGEEGEREESYARDGLARPGTLAVTRLGGVRRPILRRSYCGRHYTATTTAGRALDSTAPLSTPPCVETTSRIERITSIRGQLVFPAALYTKQYTARQAHAW